jgi:hypothetical protein
MYVTRSSPVQVRGDVHFHLQVEEYLSIVTGCLLVWFAFRPGNAYRTFVRNVGELPYYTRHIREDSMLVETSDLCELSLPVILLRLLFRFIPPSSSPHILLISRHVPTLRCFNAVSPP